MSKKSYKNKKKKSVSDMLDEIIKSESIPLPPKPITQSNIPNYLPPISTKHINKKSLILDLDETLIHSSFKPHSNHEISINIDYEYEKGLFKNVDLYVQRRPYLTDFLQRVSEKYEVIVFTASQRIYAEKVVKFIDPHGMYIHHTLYREHCQPTKNKNYIKDLSKLGRDMRNMIIIDNSPICYAWHKENAIPIKSWFNDNTDKALLDILPLLENIHLVYDVRWILEESFHKN